MSLFRVVKEYPGVLVAEEKEWKECIEASNAVVNLAGLPISTRWSSEVAGITWLVLSIICPFAILYKHVI